MNKEIKIYTARDLFSEETALSVQRKKTDITPAKLYSEGWTLIHVVPAVPGATSEYVHLVFERKTPPKRRTHPE